MWRTCVLVLALGCQHHAHPEAQHPCDQTEGPHPPLSDDRFPFQIAPTTCKKSWSPPREDSDADAACEALARDEATAQAALACYRSCEQTTHAYQQRDMYRRILQLVKAFPDELSKHMDPTCSAASYSPLRGQIARDLWHCSGLPDLPSQFGVEMRLDGKTVDYLRVEGPLGPGGASYLFTYEDVGTGCGAHAHLVQVETSPR